MSFIGIIADNKDGEILLTFADNDTLVGLSPVLPYLKGEIELKESINKGVNVYRIDNRFLAYKLKLK